MKNSTKKIMAFALAGQMILSSFAFSSFAAPLTNAEKIARVLELEVIVGEGNGVNLEQNMTRYRAFTMLIRLLGRQAEFDNFTFDGNSPTFADANEQGVSPFVQKLMAFLKANPELGVVGYEDGTLRPYEEISSKEYTRVLLEALGYIAGVDYDWNTVEALALSVGLINSLSEVSNDKVNVGNISVLTFDALASKANNNTKTLAEKLGLQLVEKVTQQLSVLSVKAVSNSLVEVKLDKEVTPADVNAANFAIVNHNNSSESLAVISATLLADNKTVRVSTAAQTPYVAYDLSVAGATKSFVGLPVDNTKPAATAVVTDNQTVTVNFSKPVDVVTATNINNYKINNNLVVLKAELNSAGTEVVLTTNEQSVGTIYTITVENVTDLSGNTMDKYETLFGGMAKDTSKPSATAVVTAHDKVTVDFSKAVSKASAENIANYSVNNGLVVLKAELNSAGTQVVLTTSEQSVGTIYNITIENVADKVGNVMNKYETLFGGMAKDTSKPSATAVVTANNKVTVDFSKAVNKASAENISNYSINNDLVVLKAELNSAGTQVVLTTSQQSVGTIYNITIENVTDNAGNVMNKYETLFGGMAKDTTAPTILGQVQSSANTVTITFSEKVSEETATNLLNYVFDGGLGYAINAELNEAGTVVTLTTANQTPGKIYNVTVLNVADVNGNIINAANNASRKSFVGVGTTSTATLNLQAVSIVNNNTIDLLFDNNLTTENVNEVAVAIDKITNDTNAGLTYEKVLQTNASVLRVQFRDDSSTNPSLFNAGVIYQATITGPANLVESNNANVKAFAGTNVTNVAPQVSTVSPINSTAVKVFFSKPVTGITSGAFTIKQGETTVAISSVSVEANDVVTEVTVNLGTALEAGKIYTLETNAGLTDGFGFIPVRTTNSNGSTYLVNFAGTNVANIAPKLDAAVATDRHTITVVYSEAVNNSTSATYTLTQNGTDLSAHIIAAEASSDKTRVTLFLDATTLPNGVEAGKIYNVSVDGTIEDLQGLAINANGSSTDRSAVFAGTNVVNAKPEIVGVSINQTNNVISLVFSEKVVGTVEASHFAITGAGFVAGLDSAVLSSDGKTVTITLENSLASNQIASIGVSASGELSIRDLNNQAPNTTTVQFGTK
ncbi:hypothetical protein EDC18_11017 [Natranaerovirga pectinivora]|uniref:Uncharacterized protein n=1 Tax=Natranaerovirga pectinivora TaxID=682400 RepID=A0A4R3MGN3_9FIRM|nr:Ig-like domain-containing protein [Natranaerovirga pectinivora]TCT12943.1 hypothetical protein EDC18_11017 [Natranaerovirga pectinivora]